MVPGDLKMSVFVFRQIAIEIWNFFGSGLINFVAQMRLWTQARQMGAFAAKCIDAHLSKYIYN